MICYDYQLYFSIPRQFQTSFSQLPKKMRELQLFTPHRDLPSSTRPLKSSSSHHNKNPRKLTKRSLNPAFKDVSEDDCAVFESPKEVSEVSDDENGENAGTNKHLNDYNAQFQVNLNANSFKDNQNFLPPAKPDAEITFLDTIESIEAELVIKYLTEARVSVVNSKDLGASAKLLDVLISVIIDEFHGIDRKDWFDDLLLNKSNIVVMSFAILTLLALFLSWIFKSDAYRFPMDGLVPT